LRDHLAVERHAARTEHANYEESSEVVPEMTPAQRAAKVEELKAKIAKRRAERELADKEAERTREIQRRKDGQKMQAAREQLEAEQRKRDAEAARRVGGLIISCVWFCLLSPTVVGEQEKMEFQKERERLRQEIAKDKAERAAQ
jgi:UBX domain-containing protein 1/4